MNEVDFTKVTCSEADKKEFTDKKDGTKGSYYVIPVAFDRGDMTTDFVVRLPMCKFWPLTEDSDSLSIIHESSGPEYKNILGFFENLKMRASQFLFVNRNRIGKGGNIKKESDALSLIKDPVYLKYTDDGKPKGSGTSYLKLLKGSASQNSSLFVGPDGRVYPKKRFYNHSLEGSPVIKIENIYCGQSYIIKISLLQVDILKIKKLNSTSIDPEYTVKDPLVVGEFLQALEEGKEEEEEKAPSGEALPPLDVPGNASIVQEFLNSNRITNDLIKPVLPLTPRT